MTAFLDKGIETVIITILHMFKKIEDTWDENGTVLGVIHGGSIWG